MVSYLGPDDMELTPAPEGRTSFIISRNNTPLAARQLAKIEGGDRVQIDRGEGWGPCYEVCDTDGEGTVLWLEEGADESEAWRIDLYLTAVVGGARVRVIPAEEQPRVSFVITGKNPALALKQLDAIRSGDRAQLHYGGSDGWGPVMEVYDTDGEGTVLWNDEGADEKFAVRLDLYEQVVRVGAKVRVLPR